MKIRNMMTSAVVASLMLTTIPTNVAVANMSETQSEINTVSVKLSNFFGNRKTTPMQITGSYLVVGSQNEELKGSFSLEVIGGKLVLKQSGKADIDYGSSFTIKPTVYNSNNFIRLNGKNYLGSMRFVIESGNIRPFNEIALEDYVKGVVASEMPLSWSTEALKAQAVAARTFVTKKGLSNVISDTQSDQVYSGYDWASGPYASKVHSAADGTEGNIVTYNGIPITSSYSSSNGGHTESNRGAWGSALIPYLSAKPDGFDPVRTYTYKMSESSLINTVRGYASGYTIKSIDTIKITELTDGKRAKTVRFEVTATDDTQKTFNIPGTTLRSLIGNGNLKSHFMSNPEKNGTDFTFSGQGFGHGVGMSQYGAHEMGMAGHGYKEILGFYYSGSTLENLNGTVEELPLVETDVPSDDDGIVDEPPKIDDGVAPIISAVDVGIIKEETLRLAFNLDENAFISASLINAGNKEVLKIGDNNQLAGNLTFAKDITNIPPGGYTLKIIAIDELGNSSEFSTIIKINDFEVLYRMDLTTNTPIYKEANLSSKKYGSLSPQGVQVVQREGEWVRIKTWLGLKWIKPVNPIVNQNAKKTLTDVRKLYNSPSPNAEAKTSISPQVVNVTATWEGKGWYKIKTWLGEKWITDVENFDKTLLLTGVTTLHNNPNNKAKTSAKIGSQKVVSVSQQGDWYQIKTWLGTKWIKPVGFVDIDGKQIYSDRKMTLHRNENFASKTGAVLSPQKLKFVEKKGDWYKVNTWLGQMWVYYK